MLFLFTVKNKIVSYKTIKINKFNLIGFLFYNFFLIQDTSCKLVYCYI